MIEEAKIQSSGQAGPEVNRDLEIIFGKVNEAVRAINTLQSTVSAITGGSNGAPPSVTDPGAPPGDDSGFQIVYEASAAAIDDQSTGVEDAWETVASGVPSGARWAIIQFEINSDDYLDDVKMYFRKQSGAQEIKVLDITPGGDVEMDHRDPMVWYFVEVTGTGTFDYKVDTTSTPNWAIRRLGYVL